jgi:hypothetical protein
VKGEPEPAALIGWTGPRGSPSCATRCRCLPN